MNLLELLVLSFVVLFFIATLTAIVVEISRRVLSYISDFIEKIHESDLYR